MSPMYRKKPIAIHAIQWTGDNADEVFAFLEGSRMYFDPSASNHPTTKGAIFDEIHTTWIQMSPGDWVMRGVQGEYYPCAESVFAETYEEVPA